MRAIARFRFVALLIAIAAARSAGAQLCERPNPDGLSWWPGDVSAADILGVNTGTLAGGATIQAGWVGQAFVFDGTDGHVAIPFNASFDFALPLQFAVAAWVNVASAAPSSNRAILVKSPASGAWDWGLYVDAENRFMAGGAAHAVVTSRTAAAPLVWYHVAFTYQDSLWQLYINGTREAVAGGTLITRSTGGLAIARRGEAIASPDYFAGALDEVELFDRALTPCAVAQLADLGRAGQCKGDDDLDGVSDVVDNCIRLHNPAQLDADADTYGDACDCAPSDATTFAIPAEVRRLAVGANGKNVVSWCTAAASGGNSSLHQLVRGEIAALPVGSPLEACLVPGSTVPSFTDSAVPPVGQPNWYLVRGTNSCGTGSYGSAETHGGPTERVSAACP